MCVFAVDDVSWCMVPPLGVGAEQVDTKTRSDMDDVEDLPCRRRWPWPQALRWRWSLSAPWPLRQTPVWFIRDEATNDVTRREGGLFRRSPVVVHLGGLFLGLGLALWRSLVCCSGCWFLRQGCAVSQRTFHSSAAHFFIFLREEGHHIFFKPSVTFFSQSNHASALFTTTTR